MTLTNEARAVLRALGGWSIADCLIDPKAGCAHLRASFWGGTHLRGYPEGTGFQCEKRGIVVTRHEPTENGDCVKTEPIIVTWKQIDNHAWTISLDVRKQLRTIRADQQWINRRWWEKTDRRCVGLAWAHHLAASRRADARLETVLAVALADEPAAEPIAEQLDLFASAS